MGASLCRYRDSDSKSGIVVSLSGVRIPPSPPDIDYIDFNLVGVHNGVPKTSILTSSGVATGYGPRIASTSSRRSRWRADGISSPPGGPDVLRVRISPI